MSTRGRLLHGFSSICPALLLAFSLALSGCGGGGSQAPKPQSPTPVSSAPAYLAQAGQVVLLHAQDGTDSSGSVSYQWNQTGGPPVLLGDAKSPNASFVMPPVAVGQDLTFSVDALHSDGSTMRETHTVTATSQQPCHEPPGITAQYVVFQADKDLDTRTDLYLAMLDSSALFRLNGPLVPLGNVRGFLISPDRRYVAYLADQDTLGVAELYVAHADGTGANKVSGTLVPSGGIWDYVWAPDSSRIAYSAAQNTAGVRELFSSRPDGSGKVRLSGPLVAGGYIYSFSWAPDSSRIAYSAVQNTAGVMELFTSRPDGAGNVRVSGPLTAGGNVSYYDFAWAPDSTRIAYAATQVTAAELEIFTSHPDGSGNVRVSHSLPSDNYHINGGIEWAPDSSRLAYRGYLNYFSNNNYFYRVDNLYTTRPDGTGATQVSAVPISMNNYRNLYKYAWAPDSSRIAYAANQNADSTVELFSSGPDGSGNVRASGPLVTGGSVLGYGFAWAPDSSRIAYQAVQNTAVVWELFTSDPMGGSNVRVSGTLVTGGNVYFFAWAPDSRYLAYSANQLNAQVWELFTATPDGSLNPRVSGNMVLQGSVQGFTWSADGSRLVYRADQLVHERYELFVAAPDGSVVNTNISGTLTANGDVFSFATQ